VRVVSTQHLFEWPGLFSSKIQRVALQRAKLDDLERPFVCCPEDHTRRSVSF
jgi:hypothetical protein